MRFTAAEEPTHPGRRLLGLALVADVGVQNAHEAALIFPFADEVLKLEAQRAALVVGQGVGHSCDAVVQQGDPTGVPLVDVSVFHTSYTPRFSCKVIGIAR